MFNSCLPGYQILNDLGGLLTKCRDGQCECLGGSAVVPNAPRVNSKSEEDFNQAETKTNNPTAVNSTKPNIKTTLTKKLKSE